MKQVVIVGAGVSGLATAYGLLNRQAEAQGYSLRVTVLEAGSRPGGRVWTEQIEGFQIEHGANSFLDTNPATLELCRSIGLDGDLIAAKPEAKARYIFWRDRLQRLPGGPIELVRSGLLSWRGKLRLLGEYLIKARRNGNDESVYEFACRRLGREAAEVLVDAMVTGIHAGDPELLSVAAAFPRLVEMEREHGGLFRALLRRRKEANPSADSARSPQGRTGTLWSLRMGMGQLVERLAASGGVDVKYGVKIRGIARDAAGLWTVRGEGVDQWTADAVVLACPSFVQAQITESLDKPLSRALAEIRFNSVTVVALGFRKLVNPPLGFGYLAPQRSRRDVLGVVWSSSIFDMRAPAGMVLLQAMCGGWNRPDIVHWDDDRLLSAVRDELRNAMGITAAPALVRIIRWPQAIPQYHCGHGKRVLAIEERRRQFGGLYLTGNSFRGVSVNDCAADAVRCAGEIFQDQLTARAHQ